MCRLLSLLQYVACCTYYNVSLAVPITMCRFLDLSQCVSCCTCYNVSLAVSVTMRRLLYLLQCVACCTCLLQPSPPWLHTTTASCCCGTLVLLLTRMQEKGPVPIATFFLYTSHIPYFFLSVFDNGITRVCNLMQNRKIWKLSSAIFIDSSISSLLLKIPKVLYF
jgi:hypothetical protein